MEKEVNNKNWGLIRNDNGEWISNEYAVFLTQTDAAFLNVKARQQGKPLHIQHWMDGLLWCYRHELEAIDLTKSESTEHELNTKKAMPEMD